MFCENCGSSVNPGNMTCPNCGMPVTTNTYFSDNPLEVKTTGLLVWSILELVCLSPLFGLIALILYFTSLKPAVASGDLGLVYKSKRTIKTLLIVGLVLGLLLPLVIVFLVAVPNFSGIQGRMQVRADMATAAQIGKAVRFWYTDVSIDPDLAIEANEEDLENKFVRLDKILLLDDYLYTEQVPSSYEPNGIGVQESAAYYVQIINAGIPNEEKVVVAIGPEDLYDFNSEDNSLSKTFYRTLKEPIETNYDGTGSGIAYVEP